jgi:hypothetical protein
MKETENNQETEHQEEQRDVLTDRQVLEPHHHLPLLPTHSVYSSLKSSKQCHGFIGMDAEKRDVLFASCLDLHSKSAICLLMSSSTQEEENEEQQQHLEDDPIICGSDILFEYTTFLFRHKSFDCIGSTKNIQKRHRIPRRPSKL